MLCFVFCLALLHHKFVFEHHSLSEHNTMKITLPLSFLLCLPAMAMADERSFNAKLRRALQDQVVSAEAGQRKLTPSDIDSDSSSSSSGSKSSKVQRKLGDSSSSSSGSKSSKGNSSRRVRRLSDSVLK